MTQFFMNRRRFFAFVGAAVMSLLLTISLPLLTPSTVVAQQNATLLVSAAASLKDALEEIKTGYQQARPGITINYNFGASGALLQQIQQGAPADIFISAGKKQVDTLEQAGGLVKGTRSNLARNRLVLIVPRNSTAGVVQQSSENTHSPIVYPVAVIKSSKSPDAAKDFVQFLSGNQAKAVFEKQGFTLTT